ncbi:YopX family protein [Eubacterium ramulus]|uniref:YopX family protein n=1 Tax=Eubacterium ramulus TaxID=39490 RepID=UPI0022E2AE77|nr:YopX family protein [Eubacterium ramulus]
MRKILCRGWSPDLNCWVYGAYLDHCNKATCFLGEDKPEYHEHKIIFDRLIDWGLPNTIKVADVELESIGEFTGEYLNEKEVYEGDILEAAGNIGIVRYGEYRNTFACNKEKHIGFYVDWTNKDTCLRNDLGYWISIRSTDVQIIGNTWENKEFEQ